MGPDYSVPQQGEQIARSVFGLRGGGPGTAAGAALSIIPPMTRRKLSAVLITRDCATTIPETLAALKFCDEIVVVDSGSSDGTDELARRAGARVIHQDWLGFGPQKQFAVEQAENDWVLCVDGDEIVSPELQASIERELLEPSHRAFEFPRCNRFLGRYLRHGEGYPDLSLRFFDRRHAHWSDDLVHEKVVALGDVGRLKGDLLHHSEETLASYLEKQNRYTSLAAEALAADGYRPHALKLAISPIFRFLKFYVFRLGFLDGAPGVIHIGIGCFNSFIKYAKVRESRRSNG
jgi:glycosyltransferase involved in cell wall biosynthesis